MTLSSTTKEQCSFMVAMKVVESLKRREDEGEKRRKKESKRKKEIKNDRYNR